MQASFFNQYPICIMPNQFDTSSYPGRILIAPSLDCVFKFHANYGWRGHIKYNRQMLTLISGLIDPLGYTELTIKNIRAILAHLKFYVVPRTAGYVAEIKYYRVIAMLNAFGAVPNFDAWSAITWRALTALRKRKPTIYK
ncbi:hypothetical protein [Pseudomonas putida]|uniref:Uncharacterized protein n=1 Tax=Pseudomonas putida TaxID=303 RepID=A0A6I7ETS0_PSEPU|nr:hypothetical protein [Pseudomonas putida]QHW08399.1 hypothetical protein C2H86_28565 [Pseudomonas putida]